LARGAPHFVPAATSSCVTASSAPRRHSMMSGCVAASWLEPTLSVEVTYSELMDGRLRDPAYRGSLERLIGPGVAVVAQMNGGPRRTRRPRPPKSTVTALTLGPSFTTSMQHHAGGR